MLVFKIEIRFRFSSMGFSLLICPYSKRLFPDLWHLWFLRPDSTVLLVPIYNQTPSFYTTPSDEHMLVEIQIACQHFFVQAFATERGYHVCVVIVYFLYLKTMQILFRLNG